MSTATAIASVSTISTKGTFARGRKQPDLDATLLELGQQWREAKRLEKLLSEVDDRAYTLAVTKTPEIPLSLTIRNISTGETRLMTERDIELRGGFVPNKWADGKRAELDQYYKARKDVDDAYGYSASNQAYEDQSDKRYDIEDLIMKAPALSVAGMALKLEVGRRYIDESDTGCGWEEAFRSVQDDLARLLSNQANEAA